MRWKPILLIATIFLSGIMVGLIVNLNRTSQERGKVQEEAMREETAAEPEIQAQDIELVQGMAGSVNWKVRAKDAQYDQDRGVVKVTAPQLLSYFGPEKREIFVRANTGEVNQKEESLALRGDITGRFGMFSVQADSLDYFGIMQKVLLKGGVIVSRPDISVSARAVEINIATRELVAAGGVIAELSPEFAKIKNGEDLLDAPTPGGTDSSSPAEDGQSAPGGASATGGTPAKDQSGSALQSKEHQG